MFSSTIAISFCFFLLCFVGIGVLSAFRANKSTEDYLLASRNVSTWLTALSACATGYSGWMFIGLVGATYTMGVSASWIIFPWIAGEYLAWRCVHKQFRTTSKKLGSTTIPGFLSGGKSEDAPSIARIAGLLTIVFLGIYAAAQLNAGSKALHVIFGWDQSLGAIIGAIIVLLYCAAGGIRASIWTDAVQAILMIFSMYLLFIVSVVESGGLSQFWQSLASIDPQLTSLTPQGLEFGLAAYVLGWLVAGIGMTGQPHIMIRPMAIDSPENIQKARRIYAFWTVLFSAACVGVGLAARLLLKTEGGFDPELSMPTLSRELLPEILVGVMIAGLFSATMSTADSQILSCSAALTQDLIPKWSSSYAYVKRGTVLITAIVLVIALTSPASVFSLVIIAWSALASAFGPLTIVRSFRLPVDTKTALSMIFVGLGCMLLWRFGLEWSSALYEVVPGMTAGALTYLLFRPKHAIPR